MKQNFKVSYQNYKCIFLFDPGSLLFSSVHSLSHVRLFATPWVAGRQASLSITNSRSLLNNHRVVVEVSEQSRLYNKYSLHIEAETTVRVGAYPLDTLRLCTCIWALNNHSRFSSVQLLSRVRLFATPWITARQASLSITNSQSSLKLMSIELVMPSSHLILCHPPLLLPPIPPSIRVFSNESTLPMRWPKYWSFIFSIIPSSEHPGLVSFRMDWLDLLAVQVTFKNFLQHHSSKPSILQHSAFFTVQL